MDFVKLKWWMKLFEEIHFKQIYPDVVTYNSLIDGFCKSGRISYALKLIGEMHDRGQPPDIFTYNSLLDAFCKNYHVDKAIELLTKLKDHNIFNQVCAHLLLQIVIWNLYFNFMALFCFCFVSPNEKQTFELCYCCFC